MQHDPANVAKRFCDGVHFIRQAWAVLRELDDDDGLIAPPWEGNGTIGRVLARVTPFMYAAMTNALVTDVVTGISRLTEGATTGKGKGTRTQLSAERVVNDLPDTSPVKPDALRLLGSLGPLAAVLEVDRNKVHAHADLDRSLDVATVSGVERRVIVDAIDALHGLVLLLGQHYGMSWDLDAGEIVAEGRALRELLARLT